MQSHTLWIDVLAKVFQTMQFVEKQHNLTLNTLILCCFLKIVTNLRQYYPFFALKNGSFVILCSIKFIDDITYSTDNTYLIRCYHIYETKNDITYM